MKPQAINSKDTPFYLLHHGLARTTKQSELKLASPKPMRATYKQLPPSEPVSVAKEWDDLSVEVKSQPSWVIAGYLRDESKFTLSPSPRIPNNPN